MTAANNKWFIVQANDLNDRLDPYFYGIEFKNLENTIYSSKHPKVKLGKILNSIVNGFDNRDYKPLGTPYLKVANVKKGELDLSNLQYIDLTLEDLTKKIKLKKGNLLLTRKGSFGNAYEIPEDLDFIISSEIFYLDIKNEQVVGKYLEIFMNLWIGQKQFDRVSIGAIMGSLSQDALKSIQIILPSLEIQHKIVDLYNHAYTLKLQKESEAQALLQSIDTYILDQLGITIPEQKNDIEDRMFYVEFDELIGDRIDPYCYLPFFNELGQQLSNVVNKKLKEIISISNETWDQKSFFVNTFPYIEISEVDISNGRINSVSEIELENAPSRAKMIVRNDDILVSTTRPDRGAITYITSQSSITIASTGFAVLRELKDESVLKEYLYHILRSKVSLLQLRQRSSGGNYPAITTEELRNINIPTPSIEIQRAIVNEIANINKRIDYLKSEAQSILDDAKAQIEKMILA